MFNAFYVESIFFLPPLNYEMCFIDTSMLYAHTNLKPIFVFQKKSVKFDVDVKALDIYFNLTSTSTQFMI